MTLSNRTKRVLAWIPLLIMAGCFLRGLISFFKFDWRAALTIVGTIALAMFTLFVFGACMGWLTEHGFFKDRKDE